MQTETLIVGGGLAGLSLADRLERAGHDWLLVERAAHTGGRIRTRRFGGVPVDLGPAWIWPGQPRSAALAARLGLDVFAQYSTGTGLFQRSGGQVQKGFGAGSMQGSLRLSGGMQGLTDGLTEALPEARILKGCPVLHLARAAQGIVADTADKQITAQRVVMALPPRIAAQDIIFAPALPEPMQRTMAAVPTWMAGHAKIVAVCERAWWREAGLSGDAISQRGPMVEIHDASPADGSGFALFGFVGVPAAARAEHQAEILHLAQEQLVALFGPQMAKGVTLHMEDWAQNPHVATAADHIPPAQHPAYGTPHELRDVWDGRMIFASSEMGEDFGGFLEGALEAAEQAAARIL
ncbi:FAD-dependent oxidoreductase [uncultured Roseobacter sp.]|uniref:flavin monoamine oxidase family protein n=1 Tax=uncultured Roseobacter sp. TaxID=114847 RepID=UPI002621C17B|nr:FAD-dependent oxidoreductase [uncultured Roseobacter sp.]